MRLPGVGGGSSSDVYESWRNWAAWWGLGLMNNICYVVFLTAAENIVAGQAGAVLAADILPTLVIKLTAPFWAHMLPYWARYSLCAAFSAASFLIVAFCEPLWLRLAGVACASVGAGWGEVTSLSLLAFYKSSAVTAWSSGTGFAGVGGAGSYVFFSQVLKLSDRDTMLIGLCFPAVFVLCYFVAMTPPTVSPGASLGSGEEEGSTGSEELASLVEGAGSSNRRSSPRTERALGIAGGEVYAQGEALETAGACGAEGASGAPLPGDGRTSDSSSLLGHHGATRSPEPGVPTSLADRADMASHTMGWRQRCAAIWLLVPVMLSLAIVYFAEYTINTGVAGTLSFPDEQTPKHEFYQRAQLTYQVGVFLSRSSGTLIPINTLWPMPVGQLVNLVFFIVQSTTQLLASGWLMLLFVAVEGLLGGLVYVNAFRRLREESASAMREFNLGVASMADTIGIAIAAGVSIWLERELDQFRAASGLPTA